jgi:hypothetical protein
MRISLLISITSTLTFVSLLATTAIAQTSELTSTAHDRQSVNITVYNSNLGLVRETRKVTLREGLIAMRFSDVTAQIRPETVHLASLTSPSALRILEQNYQYDLLNPAKLLDKYVGKEVTLVLRKVLAANGPQMNADERGYDEPEKRESFQAVAPWSFRHGIVHEVVQ